MPRGSPRCLTRNTQEEHEPMPWPEPVTLRSDRVTLEPLGYAAATS